MRCRRVIVNGMAFKPGAQLYGIHRCAYELLSEIDKCNTEQEIEIVTHPNTETFNSFSHINIKRKAYLGILSEKVADNIWNLFGFPLYCLIHKGISVDLTLTLSLPHSKVFEQYDCFFEYESKHANVGLKNKLRLFRIKKNVQKATEIITCSNFSKNDIKHYYGISDNVHVIPCAWDHFLTVDEDETIIEKLGLQGKQYFFALGSRSTRKNDKWIISAAQQNPHYTFVITGSLNFKSNISRDTIPENVIFSGYLKDSEIKSLMKHCKAFIQPSLFEGFGIPPMEAMSVGANCIVSNVTSLPEIYKDSVWYINPTDYGNIDMDKIMAKRKNSNDFILSKYSWKKSAKMFLDLLEKME